jgi:hypothetical protein
MTMNRFAWLCAAALCVAPPLYAQTPSRGPTPSAPRTNGPEETDRAIIKTQSLLPSRNRATMHPGEPLKLVGLEQGDHDLRSSTPALAQSDRAVAIVNADENYKRTLAMYDQGASYRAPLEGRSQPWSSFSDNAPDAARYSWPDGGTRAHDASASSSAAEVPAANSSNAWPWALAAIAVALVAVRFLKRPVRDVQPATAGARRA